MPDHPVAGPNLGWKLFFVLLAFALGNGTNYLAFGFHNVTHDDFDKAIIATNAKLDAQNDEIEAIRQEMNKLVVELKVRKEISITN